MNGKRANLLSVLQKILISVMILCPAFYSMRSVSFGLQAGARVAEIILLIMPLSRYNVCPCTSLWVHGSLNPFSDKPRNKTGR